jgi:hypothetical protein
MKSSSPDQILAARTRSDGHDQIYVSSDQSHQIPILRLISITIWHPLDLFCSAQSPSNGHPCSSTSDGSPSSSTSRFSLSSISFLSYTAAAERQRLQQNGSGHPARHSLPASTHVEDPRMALATDRIWNAGLPAVSSMDDLTARGHHLPQWVYLSTRTRENTWSPTTAEAPLAPHYRPPSLTLLDQRERMVAPRAATTS